MAALGEWILRSTARKVILVLCTILTIGYLGSLYYPVQPALPVGMNVSLPW